MPMQAVKVPHRKILQHKVTAVNAIILTALVASSATSVRSACSACVEMLRFPRADVDLACSSAQVIDAHTCLPKFQSPRLAC